ncbi:DUF3482 domain-containing protein [Exilibacterium tricleocarpae]|uniref:DUF3482 domain-containing protein n=1 Tax=Exilibacterium tricleocarpae TaxID=2591008 RepID=A0A545U999_9GAMM|nr:GTPase/DUF3482 domain-containing protein [Exilibacterium tricleocarpae]TQV86050.1 DUF3482 domain-containing protein [Exilibacterium tricleocarpae]
MENHKPLGPPLALAIVGHTNTGKTSLIRTLLRSSHFGQVADAAGTTRHVETATVMAEAAAVLQLFDTPGLEDSIALLQVLQALRADDGAAMPTGRDRLAQFLRHSGEHVEFDQEIKVLRQALASDVLLYVVDVREPVLGKYRDEIAVLSMVARPIIPVLNFIRAEGANLDRWRGAMADFNLHALVEFDTVAFDFEAEKRLYQKLQSVVECRYDAIQRLIDYRQRRWLSLRQAAVQQVAELIVDIASYRRPQPRDGDRRAAQADMQTQVRAAERRCLATVLAIFEFTDQDLEHHPLPVANGSWNRDLFEAATLKEFGMDAGSAAAKGAVVGAGIDLLVAGLSLGTASAAGALIGATWSGARRFGGDLLAKFKGQRWYCVDDATVTLVLLRQLRLLATLSHRGHAAQEKIVVPLTVASALPDDWSQRLNTLRNHPQWSQLDQPGDEGDRSRHRFVRQQADWIATLIVRGTPAT